MQIDPDSLWDFSDAPGSEARFRDAIDGCASDIGAAVLRTQLARALGLQRRFDEGHAELDAITRESMSGSRELTVRAELERARLFNSAGEKQDATARFRLALEIAIAAGLDVLAVDAAHMLGISEPGDAGASWTERAIELAEASADSKARKWRASLLNNLGWSRFGSGRHEDALDCFERALVARREVGDAEQTRIAHWCVGRALRELGRVEEALRVQTGLEREYEAANEPSGYVFEEMGECLLLSGRGADAPSYFKNAHELLSRDGWLVEQEPGRLERLKRLGEAGG